MPGLSADSGLPLDRMIGTAWKNFRGRVKFFRSRVVRAAPPTRLPDPTRIAAMLDQLNRALDFNAQALLLRAERTRVLASNIANADTPNFKARDIDFRSALEAATGVQMRTGGAGSAAAEVSPARTAAGHIGHGTTAAGGPTLLYRTPLQSALDANTVDMDMERAAFADNTLRYEAGLRFINGQIRTLMTAINGQS